MDETRRAQLDALRCDTCGKWHPFVRVCPFVKSQTLRLEPPRDGKRGTVQVIHTEYFERPDIDKASVESLEAADEALPEAPDPAPELEVL